MLKFVSINRNRIFFVLVALSISCPPGLSSAQSSGLKLGSEPLCSAYTGLPENWRDDPKAGMVKVSAGKTAILSFWIDQTEVTNAQFSSFVRETGYVSDAERQGGAAVFHKPTQEELATRSLAWWAYVSGATWQHPSGAGSSNADLPNLPVTLVTQADALAYARWLGRDLPTEAEWEYAAAAGQKSASLDAVPRDNAGNATANYWQGSFPTLNTGDDNHEGLAPVGCYPANDFKLYDMIGNSWEWTSDLYMARHQPHANGDPSAITPPSRKKNLLIVIKGGSFLCSRDYCARYKASSRERQEADLGASHIGFRTILREP